MPGFAAIRQRTEARKGGKAALAALLPPLPDPATLRALPDDRALAEMTRRIFCAGFVWRVIEQKWPGFEAAFHGFDIPRLCFEPDEFWEALGRDKNIVRHGAKILAVRENARFVADWPATDQVGLLDVLAKRGARLGGMTGQIPAALPWQRSRWLPADDMTDQPARFGRAGAAMAELGGLLRTAPRSRRGRSG